MAVYPARKRCSVRFEKMGREFGLEKYSSVGSIVKRTKKQFSLDKQLRNRVNKIGMELDKGQAQA